MMHTLRLGALIHHFTIQQPITKARTIKYNLVQHHTSASHEYTLLCTN